MKIRRPWPVVRRHFRGDKMSTKSLRKVLLENSYPFRLEDGELRGEGARFLQASVQRRHFFLVGEEHGVAEIPLLMAALFQTAAEYAYSFLAIEIGPLMAQALTNALSQKGPDGLKAFIQTDPLAVPFYNCAEDIHLLNTVYTASGDSPHSLWGLDQEYMFSACYFLEQLKQLASNESARVKVEQALTRARELRATGKPCLFVVQDDAFKSLKMQFRRHDVTAHQILSGLETSYRIYELFLPALQGDAEAEYESNQARELLLKRNFISQYGEAIQRHKPPPKIMFRFGYNHLARGQSQTKVHTLGNLLSELALANNVRSFNIFIMGGLGTEMRTALGGKQPSEEAERLGLGTIVESRAKDPYMLFDLKPLRPLLYARKLQNILPELEEIVWQYDAIAVLTDSTPASVVTVP
jgi:hypothetical protein